MGMNDAKKKKDDEYYTRLEDIEYELKNYKPFFKNKRIYCNCDDARWSNFWWYFVTNFTHLGLKSIDATCYHDGQHGEHWRYEGNCDPEVLREAARTRNHPLIFPYCKYEVLDNDGSFQYQDKILNETDVVVTNPPFSLFRDFIDCLFKYEKDFLIIGNNNAIVYNNVFPKIKENKIWFGLTKANKFMTPSGKEAQVSSYWYTNIDNIKRHKRIEYYTRYNEKNNPAYEDHPEAIDVSKINDIPCDWTGIIGVPITFLDAYCPDQFEILEHYEPAIDLEKAKLRHGFKEYVSRQKYVNGKLCQKTYHRMFIRWKPEAMPEIRKTEHGEIVVYN